jgi:hypothetical protein
MMMQNKLDPHILEMVEPIFREAVLQTGLSTIKPGSGKYWLAGAKELSSEQSKLIKLGKFGEKWFSEMVVRAEHLEILPHGVISGVIPGKKKDIDLLFRDVSKNIVYYYELKSNINLDTEKLPATIEKVKMIEEYLKKVYPEYQIKSAILNWSVYSKKEYEKNKNSKPYISKIAKFKSERCSIEFTGDFVKIVNYQQLTEQQFLLLGPHLDCLEATA